MRSLKKSRICKALCIFLVVTFVAFDIAWAYPADGAAEAPHSPRSSTLAAPYATQAVPVTEQAARLQRSIIAEKSILLAIFDIAEYFLGDDAHKIGSLPLKHIEGAMQTELAAYRASTGINLSLVEFTDGVITVRYAPETGKGSRIFIALKDNLAIRDLAGHDAVVSERYAVKVLPEGYVAAPQVSAPAEIAEEPSVTLSEPVMEVTKPAAEAEESASPAVSKTPAKKITLRAIITSALMIVFMALPASATESASFIQQYGLMSVGISFAVSVGVLTLLRLFERRQNIDLFDNIDARQTTIGILWGIRILFFVAVPFGLTQLFPDDLRVVVMYLYIPALWGAYRLVSLLAESVLKGLGFEIPGPSLHPSAGFSGPAIDQNLTMTTDENGAVYAHFSGGFNVTYPNGESWHVTASGENNGTANWEQINGPTQTDDIAGQSWEDGTEGVDWHWEVNKIGDGSIDCYKPDDPLQVKRPGPGPIWVALFGLGAFALASGGVWADGYAFPREHAELEFMGWLGDIAATYYVSMGVCAAAGIGLFFAAWRIVFPARWHAWRMGSKDPATRFKAAYALIRIADLRSALPSANTFGDKSGDMNRAVAKAFLILRDRNRLVAMGAPAVPTLVNALTGEWRTTAAEALMLINDEEGLKAVEASLGTAGLSVTPLMRNAHNRVGEMISYVAYKLERKTAGSSARALSFSQAFRIVAEGDVFERSGRLAPTGASPLTTAELNADELSFDAYRTLRQMIIDKGGCDVTTDDIEKAAATYREHGDFDVAVHIAEEDMQHPEVSHEEEYFDAYGGGGSSAGYWTRGTVVDQSAWSEKVSRATNEITPPASTLRAIFWPLAFGILFAGSAYGAEQAVQQISFLTMLGIIGVPIAMIFGLAVIIGVVQLIFDQNMRNRWLSERARGRMKRIAEKAEGRILTVGYTCFKHISAVAKDDLMQKITAMVAAKGWADRIDEIKLLSDRSSYVASPQLSLELEYFFTGLQTGPIEYRLKLHIYPRFAEKIIALYEVWPEMAEKVLASMISHESGHVDIYEDIKAKKLPPQTVFNQQVTEARAFRRQIAETGEVDTALTVYWLNPSLSPSYDREAHTRSYFESFRSPFVALTDSVLDEIVQIEDALAKRKGVAAGSTSSTPKLSGLIWPVIAGLGALLVSGGAFADGAAFMTERNALEFYGWVGGFVGSHWVAALAVAIVVGVYALAKHLTAKRVLNAQKAELVGLLQGKISTDDVGWSGVDVPALLREIREILAHYEDFNAQRTDSYRDRISLVQVSDATYYPVGSALAGGIVKHVSVFEEEDPGATVKNDVRYAPYTVIYYYDVEVKTPEVAGTEIRVEPVTSRPRQVFLVAYGRKWSVTFGQGSGEGIEIDPSLRELGSAWVVLGSAEEQAFKNSFAPTDDQLWEGYQDITFKEESSDSAKRKTTYSVIPFLAAGLGAFGLASGSAFAGDGLMQAGWFAALYTTMPALIVAYPVMTLGACGLALAVGAGLFCAAWRVFFPLSWYAMRLRISGYWGSRAAIEALYRRGAPALPLLLNALGDPDRFNNVRRDIAWAIARMNDPRSIAFLVKLLKAKHYSVPFAAAEALGWMKWTPSNNEEEVLYEAALQRWDRLVDMGERALPVLARIDDDGVVAQGLAQERARRQYKKDEEALIGLLEKKVDMKQLRWDQVQVAELYAGIRAILGDYEDFEVEFKPSYYQPPQEIGTYTGAYGDQPEQGFTILSAEELSPPETDTVCMTDVFPGEWPRPGTGSYSYHYGTPGQTIPQVLQVKPAGRKLTDPATVIADVVETHANNTRAAMAQDANALAATLAGQLSAAMPAVPAPVNKAKPTAEVKRAIAQIIAAALSVPAESAPHITATAERLRKGLDQLEADGIVSMLIGLARAAKRDGQKLIIGLETGWMPGYDEKGSFQHSAMNPLMKEIKSAADALRSMGLDNIEIIDANGNELAGKLVNRAEETHTRLTNIIVIASRASVESAAFEPLRSTQDEARAFLTAIDPAELDALYREAGSLPGKVLDIEIMEIISIALDLAAGKEPPQIPMMASYDRVLRIVTLLPKARIIDYQELRDINHARIAALTAA